MQAPCVLDAVEADIAASPVIIDYKTMPRGDRARTSPLQIRGGVRRGVQGGGRPVVAPTNTARNWGQELAPALAPKSWAMRPGTVLIIGASRGIGLELARLYAQSHQRVLATSRVPVAPATPATPTSPATPATLARFDTALRTADTSKASRALGEVRATSGPGAKGGGRGKRASGGAPTVSAKLLPGGRQHFSLADVRLARDP